MIPFSRGARQILDPFAQNWQAAIREPSGGDQQTMQITKNMMSKTSKIDFLKIAVMRP